MDFVEKEIDSGLDYIPEEDGRMYIRAPIDFILDLIGIIQGDWATWVLEVYAFFLFTVIPMLLIGLFGKIGYDAAVNPEVHKLLLKNLGIFRDLVVSKLPSSVTSFLPAMITGK